jgi:hypothetical protein
MRIRRHIAQSSGWYYSRPEELLYETKLTNVRRAQRIIRRNGGERDVVIIADYGPTSVDLAGPMDREVANRFIAMLSDDLKALDQLEAQDITTERDARRAEVEHATSRWFYNRSDRILVNMSKVAQITVVYRADMSSEEAIVEIRGENAVRAQFANGETTQLASGDSREIGRLLVGLALYLRAPTYRRQIGWPLLMGAR